MRVGIPIPLVTPSWSKGSPRAPAHGSAPLAPGAKLWLFSRAGALPWGEVLGAAGWGPPVLAPAPHTWPHPASLHGRKQK